MLKVHIIKHIGDQRGLWGPLGPSNAPLKRPWILLFSTSERAFAAHFADKTGNHCHLPEVALIGKSITPLKYMFRLGWNGPYHMSRHFHEAQTSYFWSVSVDDVLEFKVFLVLQDFGGLHFDFAITKFRFLFKKSADTAAPIYNQTSAESNQV